MIAGVHLRTLLAFRSKYRNCTKIVIHNAPSCINLQVQSPQISPEACFFAKAMPFLIASCLFSALTMNPDARHHCPCTQTKMCTASCKILQNRVKQNLQHPVYARHHSIWPRFFRFHPGRVIRLLSSPYKHLSNCPSGISFSMHHSQASE